jgi:hypothetical protein
VVVGFEFIRCGGEVLYETADCKIVLRAWQEHYFPESQETSLYEESLGFIMTL